MLFLFHFGTEDSPVNHTQPRQGRIFSQGSSPLLLGSRLGFYPNKRTPTPLCVLKKKVRTFRNIITCISIYSWLYLSILTANLKINTSLLLPNLWLFLEKNTQNKKNHFRQNLITSTVIGAIVKVIVHMHVVLKV